MRRKIPLFSKLALSIFLAIFALCSIFLNGDGAVLKPSIAEAANPGINLTKDDPGIRTAIEVQSRHTETLMNIPGVVGHGVGISSDGEPVITLFVVRAGIPGIPAALEGVRTKVKVTGMVVAYADPTARFPRPVPIGVSTGHPDITAGTVGCRVTDGTNVFALSNNHVYANENDGSLGDSGLQPGPYDGGQDPEDAIGTLYAFEPIDFSGGDNIMDAAIVLSSVADLGTSTPSGDGYGTPSSTIVEASLGQGVQKYGRTTGWTHGVVDTIKTTVDVCYQARGPFRCVKMARFVDQIAIEPGTFSAGGDSGSLIVTDDGNHYTVGLLFAGSSTHTIANRIAPVLERFGVTVDDSFTTSPDNYPPNADFSFTPSGLTVNFNEECTDSDGHVVDWSWDFGDGSDISIIQNPTHTYSASGTYIVTLTVTDDDGATDSVSKDVTVSDTSGGITLTATGYKVRGRQKADLEWNGATSPNVDIYRDGNKIDTTANEEPYTYTDNIDRRGGGSYTYQVCEAADTSTCSNEATVTF